MSEYIISDELDVLRQWMPKLTEIVRCRDCRHYYEAEEYHPQGNYKKLCCKHFFTFDDEVNPNGFCAWGERKVVGE